MRSAAADQQVRLADALARRDEVERMLAEERAKWEAQQEEWQQFQKDLLTTVRVANDFKLETLASMEKVVEENRILREKLGMPASNLVVPTTTSATTAAPTTDRNVVRPRILLRSLSSLESSSVPAGLGGAADIKPRAIATRVDKKGSVKRIVENLEVTSSASGSARSSPISSGSKPVVESPVVDQVSPMVALSPTTAISSPPVATVRPRSEPVRPSGQTPIHRTESETVFLRVSPGNRPGGISAGGSDAGRLSDPIFNKPTQLRVQLHSASDLQSSESSGLPNLVISSVFH